MEHINLKYVNCKIMKGLTSHFTDTKKRKKKTLSMLLPCNHSGKQIHPGNNFASTAR